MPGYTIERCPHDKENPYVMISNDLIRDQSISPACRWLLIYLLSNKQGWKIQISQIVEHVKGQMGRNAVYNLVDEALEAGYMQRITVYNKNLRNGVKYFVSEFPKFKKCFRHPGIQDTEAQNAENRHSKEEPISSNEDIKKEHKADPKIGDVASSFFNRLIELNPKIPKPNLSKWTKEIEKLVKAGNSIEDVQRVISYVMSTKDKPTSNGFCWANVILSAAALRKHFPKLWAEMRTENPKKNGKMINSDLAETIKKTYGHRPDINFGEHNGEKYIEFTEGSYQCVIYFKDEEFRKKLSAQLARRKLKIE